LSISSTQKIQKILSIFYSCVSIPFIWNTHTSCCTKDSWRDFGWLCRVAPAAYISCN